MSDVLQRPKERKPPRRQRSICQVHYNLRPRTDDMTAKPLLPSPTEVQKYGQQVAGHQGTNSDTKYLGLLQRGDGTILKPILKECQKREVEFYEKVFSSDDEDLAELRKFVPKYFGCQKFTYNGFQQDYIILEDLTLRMLEPCIMDVKIGRITWDPFASKEKIANEMSKYAECKREFGFCIPGYQVYRTDCGRRLRYGKDCGKKLRGHMVTAAIRNYLNGAGRAPCRALVLQLVAALWALQRWAARPRALRLRAASLLLVYDAAPLAACCPLQPGSELTSKSKCRPSEPIGRRNSIHSMHSPVTGSNFSGQISSKGPVYKKLASVPLSPMSSIRDSFSPPPPVNSPWSEALEKLNHNHSFENNYEHKLCKIKMNYRAQLDQLSQDSPNPHPWGTVKVIDFAHAYFNEEKTVDYNFKEGLDNFVAIFENLLKETDDQVF